MFVDRIKVKLIAGKGVMALSPGVVKVAFRKVDLTAEMVVAAAP